MATSFEAVKKTYGNNSIVCGVYEAFYNGRGWVKVDTLTTESEARQDVAKHLLLGATHVCLKIRFVGRSGVAQVFTSDYSANELR